MITHAETEAWLVGGGDWGPSFGRIPREHRYGLDCTLKSQPQEVNTLPISSM